MRFGTAKYVTLGLLLAALAIGVNGAFMFEENTVGYTTTVVVVVVLFAVGLIVGLTWARCPNCGATLFFRMLKWNTCPRCGKKIDQQGKYHKNRKK